MKGFGRNFKFLFIKGHELQVVIYGLFFLVLAFFGIMDREALPILVEIGSVFILVVMFALDLIIVGMGEGYCKMMVYFGSIRRPAVGAILLGQYVFWAE